MRRISVSLVALAIVGALGAMNNGCANGDTTATATGGSIGSGGSTGTGGAVGSGGSPATGGAPGTGGATGTGGTPATGGTTGTGGATGAAGGSGFGQPVCGSTGAGTAIAKGVACTGTDPQLCYKTCGPVSIGVKSETCVS